MPGPSLRAEIETMRAEGRFFTADVTKTIAANVKDAVEWVAKQGPGLIPRYETKRDTGFTADPRNWEGFAYKRTRFVGAKVSGYLSQFGVDYGTSVASLYGKVRMKGGLSRPVSAGTDPKYGPERRPYIVNAVLEGGRGRGQRTPVRHVRKTAARLRGMVRAIRVDLTKGLD